jgi:pyrroline-5-carboxylate reductase
MIRNKKIAFIGAGAMTEAILSGLLEKNKILGQNITILNKSNKTRLNYLIETYGLAKLDDPVQQVRDAEIIIFAMKPIDVEKALLKWKDIIHSEQIIISVAAGIPTLTFEKILPENNPVIRAMPNTSSAVGRSATAICTGKWANQHHLQIAEEIFAAIGIVVSVEEEMMDAVTGLSGSGPAYFYYMVEALEQAGVAAGLEPEIARTLTLQTILGAAHMLAETGKRPEQLREEVTSPGGTTMAGLKVLRDYRVNQAIIQAVLRAKERSEEMGRVY